MLRIKTSLSKKGASLENAKIFNALCSATTERVFSADHLENTGRGLLSNPFLQKAKNRKKRKTK